MRKTKIVCTLGPASNTKDIIKELALAGMNVARFNMSHGTHQSHKEMIDIVKQVRKELNIPIAIMIDTKGPEIRIKQFEEGSTLLTTSQRFVLTTRNIVGNHNGVAVTLASFNKIVKPGNKILLNDGLIKLEVDSIDGQDVICKVLIGGTLSNNKSINIPGVSLDMPYLSDVDKDDLLFGIKEEADIFSISFVSSAQDVLDVRAFLKKHKYEQATICSKIESAKGVENMDDIIEASDAIMVARGDLGVEVDFEKIPYIQKQLIAKSIKCGRSVITATEMLESMINNPRPTRAEISDIANAVLDGTSAVMLSGESSAGKHPVLSVKTMAKIAEECEKTIDYNSIYGFTKLTSISSSIGFAACELSKSLNAKAIVVATIAGFSAKSVSRFRPECPIIACTPSYAVYNKMALYWGVYPCLDKTHQDTDSLLKSSRQIAWNTKLVKKGDLVVQTASTFAGRTGSNLLLVENI